jgi:hypothetical protein
MSFGGVDRQIMVNVNYRGRLGNRLFQYCLGRIIAEELGLELRAASIEEFPNTKVPVKGRVFDSPIQELVHHRINLPSILADRSPRQILLHGWFQRIEYYAPYRSQIREWLRIDAVHETPCLNADVVVHIRRGDYVELGWALPFSYYEEAIQAALPNGGRVVIVTDDPHDLFLRRFRKFKPFIFRASSLQTMSYMVNAPRLVLSASTFGWWPAFLGNAHCVYWPKPTFIKWSDTQFGDDIALDDPERFNCIECPVGDQPTFPEKWWNLISLYREKIAWRVRSGLGRGPAPRLDE